MYRPECLNCQKPSHWARVCHSNQEGVRGRSKNRGVPDQGSGLEADDANVEEDLQAQSI